MEGDGVGRRLAPEGALDREGLALGVVARGVGEAACVQSGVEVEVVFFFYVVEGGFREEKKIEVEVEFFFSPLLLFFFFVLLLFQTESTVPRISKFYYGCLFSHALLPFFVALKAFFFLGLREKKK